MITDIIGWKDRAYLCFERQFDGSTKEIMFDMRDKTFYRTLKRGGVKEVPDSSVATFFRGLTVAQIAEGFEDKAYADLIRLVGRRSRDSRITNFGTIFSDVSSYMHNESYLVLGIKFSDSAFSRPVSQFSKPVIRFMRESGLTFERSWEKGYEKHPDIVTNLVTYAMQNFQDSLEVYRMVVAIVGNDRYSGSSLDLFYLMTLPVTEKTDRGGYYHRDEYGYGLEYKALFNYLIRLYNVEAMNATDAVQELYDYLKMARQIEKMKYAAQHPDVEIEDSELPGYHRVEKYPPFLTVLHRVVTRNFNALKTQYDDVLFAQNADQNYAYEGKGYMMVVPKVSQDVKDEGTNQAHCVASYVDSIIEGKTQIVFMRAVKDESLVTVEIRANAIQQARGYRNRDLTTDEIAWLEHYAKVKNVSYGKVEHDPKEPSPRVTVSANENVKAEELAAA